jgi:hypothetical protein
MLHIGVHCCQLGMVFIAVAKGKITAVTEEEGQKTITFP